MNMSSSVKLDDANLIKCKGCPGKFLINAIRRHVANNPSCHEKYSALECKELEQKYQAYRKATRAAQYKEKKYQNPAKGDVDSTSTETSIQDAKLISCKGCLISFKINVILNHLLRKKSCRNKYSDKEISDLKEICKTFSKKKNNMGKRKKWMDSTQAVKKQKSTDPGKRKIDETNSGQSMKKHHPTDSVQSCTTTYSSEDIIKSDIYSDGCRIINIADQWFDDDTKTYFFNIPEKTNKDKKLAFYDRLEKKYEILNELNNSVDKISKSSESYSQWLKNLMIVKQSFYDQINHHVDEIEIWFEDIWREEMGQAYADFENDDDLDDDIAQYDDNFCTYQKEVINDLHQEIDIIFNPFSSKDKSTAKQSAQQVDKKALCVAVKKLANYIEWNLQNIYDYFRQYTYTMKKHIQWQTVGYSNFYLLQFLIPYLSPVFNVSDWEISEIVICKGCPNNPKKFSKQTILKHLKHKANKSCLAAYKHEEILELEKISKLRAKIMDNEYHQERFREKSQYLLEMRRIDKRIEDNTNKLNPELKKPKIGPVRKTLQKIYCLFLKKCIHEKDNRIKQFAIDFEKLVILSSHFENNAEFVENLAEWQTEIETEIMETFYHLKKEVKRKYEYFFGNYVNPDAMVGRNVEVCYTGERKSFKSFRWDAKELLHYVKWRQNNSYAICCENIRLIAEHVEKQMKDVFNFPKEIIKTPNYQDFKMLTYNEVPGYDPSEGIRVSIKRVHPKDHPSYPHYCYEVYLLEYSKWLAETSVFTLKALPTDPKIPDYILNNIDKNAIEIPVQNKNTKVCTRTDICKYRLRPNGRHDEKCYENDCKFSEENPVCPVRPRCVGCKIMFHYRFPTSIEEHLKENETCLNSYSSESYNELMVFLKTKKDQDEEKRERLQREFVQNRWDRWQNWFKKYNKTEEDIMRKDFKEYLKDKKNWNELQRKLNPEKIDHNDENSFSDKVKHLILNDGEKIILEPKNDEFSHDDIDNEKMDIDDDQKNEAGSSSLEEIVKSFHCKFCDEDFSIAKDKLAHEIKFHPTFNLDEKALLASTDDESKDETESDNKDDSNSYSDTDEKVDFIDRLYELQKKPYQRGSTFTHGNSSYFTSRVDNISKDPPLVLRFANPRGKFCWWNSSLTSLIWCIKLLIQRGHQFQWPQYTEVDFAVVRPFINFLEEYVDRDEIIPEDPVHSMTAWITEFHHGNEQLLRQTGYAAEFFQTIFNSDEYGTFFDFAKPQICITTKTTICTICDIEATEGVETNGEVFIELRNLDQNLTLEENILEHLSGEFKSEEAVCRCGNGYIQIDTKQQLATLPLAIIVKLGFEQYNPTGGRVIKKRSLKLGNNLNLECLDGTRKEYELVCGVAHTGLSGDSAESGHFMSYLKKSSDQQEYCWNCYNDTHPILQRPESFVEECDIFIFIQVSEGNE